MELELERVEEGSDRTETVTVDAAEGDALKDVLQTAGIAPETVLIERDGTIVPKTETVRADDDRFRILDVISGG